MGLALLTFSHCSDRSRPIKAPPGEAVRRPWRGAEPMTGSGMRPLDRPCSEQGKRPTAKAFKLAERDINMSEQKQESSFMQELDRWTESTIIGPLFASETDGADWEPAIERVKKAIRQKVLE